MNGLDLFSGIGGISIALKPWVRTVAYCENDRYAQGVLLSRMRSGDLDQAPIWDDVCTLRASNLPAVDIIFGGFPCQDISAAGSRKGLDGERSGLVFEMLRLIGECRPRLVFMENSPNLASMGLERILLDLDALGYDARWSIVSAEEVGAAHLRERIWIVAHADSERGRIQPGGGAGRTGKIRPTLSTFMREITDDDRKRLEELHRRRQRKAHRDTCTPSLQDIRNPWTSEPCLRRGVHGVPNRVDRIRCLGNSVCPQAAREAFKRLAGIES